MAISKVVLNGTTLMDATTATAAAEDITAPKTAMLADGVVTTGTGTGGGGYTIEDIATNVFYAENLVLPDTITEIASGAFAMKNLSSISGSGVISVGDRSFVGVALIASRLPFSFDFPNLEIANTYAFNNVNFGNQPIILTAYTCNASLFEGCINLPSVKYTRATTIQADQVYNVPTLTRIIINSTPTTINTNAFRRTTGLTDIYVPWSEGAVANAPWGATTATIHYDTTFDANGDPT